MRIPLSKPDITNKEIKYITQVLKTPNLSLGPKLSEFEEKIAHYVGSKYAIAVNSGTSGLHLCIKALGISEGDEVITTSFSFIASANCILFERAKPVLVDIDSNTLNIDPNNIDDYLKKKVKANNNLSVKAILPVHVFGQPCDMDSIMKIARRYNLIVIEDACEAIGAEYLTESDSISTTYWRKVGTIGNAGVFAFYPNKQITTGEGGIIVTDDEKLAGILKSLRNQGRDENGKWLTHIRLGYNYRISDINCALGIAQLERINEILQKRVEISKMYNEKLKDIEGIKIPFCSAKSKKSWFVYVVQLDERFGKEHRDKILKGLVEREIGCNNYFPPIHLQPLYVNMFGFKKGDLPITESISERTIALPFYDNLREEEVEFVCESLKQELIKQQC